LTLQRPVPPDNMKHTAPREKCLCLKQQVHTTWENVEDPDLAVKFKEVAKAHNDKFNPSGVPFKSRRPAEDPIETLPGALAEPLRPRDGQYPDLTALKAGALNVRSYCLPSMHLVRIVSGTCGPQRLLATSSSSP
jgi:hypothetical protein